MLNQLSNTATIAWRLLPANTFQAVVPNIMSIEEQEQQEHTSVLHEE